MLALGGGVIGDLTGFAASVLKRGCGFIQLPTTLLAQIDSSVGGKVAINHPAGKNLIGAFYQPRLVLADTATLLTLSDREYRAGLGEMVKYGVLGVEMEASALYTLAAKYGRRSLAICTVSDHVVTGEETSSDERERTFADMVDIALSAAVTAG